MQIGLDDMDPQIADALADRLAAPPPEFLRDDIHWGGILAWCLNLQSPDGGLAIKRKRAPTPTEKRAFELRKKREEQFGLRLAGTLFFPAMVAAAAAGGLDMLHAGGLLELMTGSALWMAGTGAGAWWTGRAMPKSRLRQNVTLDEMKAVFPLLTLTRPERIYCDTLELLSRIPVAPESEVSIRETLRQISALLESSRQLEARRQGLMAVRGANVTAELEAEYGALGRKLDTTTDAITRQSIERSLQMCQTRLQNAIALESGLERLNAQQEAIVQTLSTVQSALVRAQVAPEPQSNMVAEEIAETVAQLNQQTYSVEKAVEEVMTLGARQ